MYSISRPLILAVSFSGCAARRCFPLSSSGIPIMVRVRHLFGFARFPVFTLIEPGILCPLFDLRRFRFDLLFSESTLSTLLGHVGASEFLHDGGGGLFCDSPRNVALLSFDTYRMSTPLIFVASQRPWSFHPSFPLFMFLGGLVCRTKILYCHCRLPNISLPSLCSVLPRTHFPRYCVSFHLRSLPKAV